MKKVLAIGVGALALGGAAAWGAWVAGSAIPEERETRFTVATRQGPSAVWQVVSDFEQHPAWRAGLAEAERVEDIAGKPAWRETGASGDATTLVTAAWEPPHSLRRDIVEDGLLLGSWTVDLLPEGMGTRITFTERRRTPSPFARLLQQRTGGAALAGPAQLRALADHLGDPQNQVVEVDETGE